MMPKTKKLLVWYLKIFNTVKSWLSLFDFFAFFSHQGDVGHLRPLPFLDSSSSLLGKLTLFQGYAVAGTGSGEKQAMTSLWSQDHIKAKLGVYPDYLLDFPREALNPISSERDAGLSEFALHIRSTGWFLTLKRSLKALSHCHQFQE